MKNILIIGGAGFIGLALTKALINEGHKVKVYDRNSRPSGLDSHQNLEWISGDFDKEASWGDVVAGIDIVYHLVSDTTPATSNTAPVSALAQNTLSSLKLLEGMVQKETRKIVFLSSGGTVYGNPNCIPITELHQTNPIVAHGIQKLIIEKYLLLYRWQGKLDPIIFRLSNPYGPGQMVKGFQGVISALIKSHLAGQSFQIWGDGSVTRDFIYIDDVISALVQATNYAGNKAVFNLGAGIGYSINSVCSLLSEIVKKPIAIDRRDGRPFDVPVNILDNTLVREELGWEPTVNLKDGLSKTFNEMNGSQ